MININNAENDQVAAIRILIVEDSSIQSEILRRALVGEGYTVSVAKNGAEGFVKTRELSPDLVISDILMPVMDGFELCSNIKADEKLRSTPVILLTSLSDPHDVIRAVQCCADQFVTKPFEEKHLFSTIERLLHSKNLNDLEENQKGIQIFHKGEKYLISSNRIQILTLLLSTYETAVAKNRELIETQAELKRLNQSLEEIVDQRTAALRVEVNERKAAEAALQASSDEIKTISQQLLQAEKLATMGELASSIAHELNNPLATVSLRVESLIAKATGDDLSRRELEIIDKEIERMGNLVTNLLQFSRRSQQQISTVTVCDEIEKTLELIHYHLRKHNITVAREFEPEGPLIHADRQQLRQLFLNLFTNASDAMPEGGTLTIRMTRRPEERQICIEIADTGVGIPPEILPKIMEPFYTTKPEGKGTGLGLAICRRIAQAHHGTLNITSEGGPGNGTRVCITLPFSNGHNTASLRDG